MSSYAILRNIRLSPKKTRLIARQIQGMNAEYALASLEFTANKAAKILYKVLASAIANGNYQPEEVMIVSCLVDEGRVLKRIRARARGTASRIKKPTAHITIVVKENNTAIKDKKTKIVNKNNHTDTTQKNVAKEHKDENIKSDNTEKQVDIQSTDNLSGNTKVDK